MIKWTPQQMKAYEDLLIEMYPDVILTGIVSKTQLAQVNKDGKFKYHPTWLTQDDRSISRTQFNFYPIETEKKEPLITMEATTKQRAVNPEAVKFIPAVDPNYVEYGCYNDMEKVAKSGMFFPALVSGPTGNGKSETVEQIHAKNKLPLIRINIHASTDENELIGSKTLVDGNIEIVEGPVLIAMRLGIPLLLDEVDAGDANRLLCLQPILEGKPYYFKLKNEVIAPQPGFNIWASANTKGRGSVDGRYMGTNVLNEAFLERFVVTFEWGYPQEASEKTILTRFATFLGLERQEIFIDTLCRWAKSIRETSETGGIDETMSTRRLKHIIKAFSVYQNDEKAVALCLTRFDEQTKDAFQKLYLASRPAPKPSNRPTMKPEPPNVDF